MRLVDKFLQRIGIIQKPETSIVCAVHMYNTFSIGMVNFQNINTELKQ